MNPAGLHSNEINTSMKMYNKYELACATVEKSHTTETHGNAQHDANKKNVFHGSGSTFGKIHNKESIHLSKVLTGCLSSWASEYSSR